jgi:hypothetical protein
LVVGSSGDAGGGRHRCARSDSETRGGAGEYGDDDDDDKWSGKKVRVYGRVVGVSVSCYRCVAPGLTLAMDRYVSHLLMVLLMGHGGLLGGDSMMRMKGL